MFSRTLRETSNPYDDQYVSHVPLSQFVQMPKTIPGRAEQVNWKNSDEYHKTFYLSEAAFFSTKHRV